jgi:autotransporter-associated beta strand protein
MITSWRGLLLASSALAFIGSIGSLTLGMETAAAQALLSEGPGPATTLPDWYQFQGTAVSGAVQAIAPSLSTPGIIYLGSANGGVWKSVNNGASWTPSTDQQSSLSIGALAVDPTNAAHVIAGIGRSSSAAYAGGPLIGLLSSDNGGGSWTTLTPSGLPAGRFANFTSLSYDNGAILAGSDSTQGPSLLQGGVYRIDANGAGSWAGQGISLQEALTDPAKPLPVGVPVTSLVIDPSNGALVYAAVANAPDEQLNGIYRSSDGGASFTRVVDSTMPKAGSLVAASVNIRLAAGADGTVYAVTATRTGPSASSAQALLKLNPATNQWSVLPVNSALMSAEQGDLHLALAVDPTNSDVIYIGSSPPNSHGATGIDESASNLYRGVLDPATGTISWTDIGALATTKANPHSDFRTFAFDSNGDILVGSDGGIYRNTSATPESNAWQPIMNGYVGGELYGVSWNSISKTVAGAFQDNGVSTQIMQGSPQWRQFLGADGTNVAINTTTLRGAGKAVLYGTTQSLGFLGRVVLDSANNFVGTSVIVPTLNGAPLPEQPFSAKFALDRLDPSWFAIGGSSIFVGQDPLDTLTAEQVEINVSDIARNETFSSSGVAQLAFGSRENAWRYGLVAAAYDSQDKLGLYATADAAAAGAAVVRLDLPAALTTVSALALAPSSPGQIFAVGNRHVYFVQADPTCLGGAVCGMRDLGTSLPSTLASVSAVTAIDNNGVNALFVGGQSTTATGNGVGNIYTLQNDQTHAWENSLWRAFGTGLPNVNVTQLTYSYTDDLLAVATLGRGAWIIPDVTSYFDSALRIVLGNGGFDSLRGDNFTDGTTSGRPLVKVGAGTVTLSGTNSYTGGTALDAGVLSVSRDANLGTAAGSLTFNGGILRNTDAFASARSVLLNATGGGFQTDAPLTLTGVLSGSGALNALGPQVLTLTNKNTYSGATIITGGATLALNGHGSIAASAGLADSGIFDISATNAGADITTLSGGGRVNLGAQRLTLTNAHGTFAGTIADGGVAGGTGGSFRIASGTETLSGTNTYSGSTGIARGATLTLSGTGSLVNSSADQDSGVLRVDGTIGARALTIGSAGMLEGTGVIAAPTRVSGTLAPGDSPGTLTFLAPVALASSATSDFAIDGMGTGTGAGSYSRVLVLGAGNGFSVAGVLVPQLRGIIGSASNQFTPTIGQSFTILYAAGGISGSYTGLAQPAGLGAGTRFDALYGGTTLTLAVTPSSYADLGLAGIAETSTQSAVGAALDATRPAAGLAMSANAAALYTPLYGQTAATLPTTLQQLSPSIYADGIMTSLAGWSLVGHAVEQELDAQRGAPRGPQAYATTNGAGRTIWMTGLGQFTSVNSSDAPGYDGSVGGVAAGVDAPFQPGLRAGLAFAFTSPNIQDRSGASLSGDAFELLGYGSFQKGPAFADLQFGGSYSENTITRPEPVYALQAQGQANGSAGGGLIRVGLHLPWAGWQVDPGLTLSAASFTADSVNERQGGATSLAIAGTSAASVETLLGVQMERSFAVGQHMALTPHTELGWMHQLADTNATVQASFLSLGGPAFSVNSAALGRNFAVLGLGASLSTGGALALYVSYAGAFNSQAESQNITGGLRLRW